MNSLKREPMTLGVIIWLTFFFSSSFFIPDPHHDGIVFFYGNQVAQGLVPNRDFYSQWGPLYAFIVSIPILLFSEMYSLRIFQGLSLMVLIIIFYKISKIVLPANYSYLGSFLFLISYPGLVDMGGDQRYPSWQAGWPNLYGFIFVASSTLIFLNYYNLPKRRSQTLYLIFIVCSLNLSLYIRVNFIFLIIMISLAYLVVIFKTTGSINLLLQFIAYTAIFHSVAIGLMFFMKTLKPWWSQNVVDPIAYSSVGFYGNFGFKSILETFIFISALIMILFAIAWIRNGFGQGSFEYVFVILLFSGIFSLVKFSDLQSTYLLPKNYFDWLAYLLGDVHLSFLALAMVSIFLFPIYVLRSTKKFKSETLILYSGAIGTLGLLHNLKLDYVWINSFFLYLMLMKILAELNDRRGFSLDLLKTSVLIVVVCLILSVILNISKTWGSLFVYKSSPISRMISTDIERALLTTENLMLFGKIPKEETAISLCPDLLYDQAKPIEPEALFDRALVRANLLSMDKPFPTFLSNVKYVFICDLNEGEFDLLEMRIQSRATIFAESEVLIGESRSVVLEMNST